MVILDRWRRIAGRASLLALIATGGCVVQGEIGGLPARPRPDAAAPLPDAPAAIPPVADAAPAAAADAASAAADVAQPAPPDAAPMPVDMGPLPPVSDPTAPPRTPPAPPPSADLSRALIVFLPADEGTGTTLHDDSGFQQRAALVDGDPVTSWGEGRFGKALALGGGNKGAYVRVESAPNLISARIEMSFAAWVLLPPTASGTLVSRRNAGSGGYLFNVRLAKGRLSANINVGNGYTGAVNGPTELPPGAWTHVAMTFDSQFLKLFVNGQVVATAEYRLSVPPSLTPILIGATEVESADHDTVVGVMERLPARIDDMLLYDRMLSDDDVIRLANGVRPVPVPTMPPPPSQ